MYQWVSVEKLQRTKNQVEQRLERKVRMICLILKVFRINLAEVSKEHGESPQCLRINLCMHHHNTK